MKKVVIVFVLMVSIATVINSKPCDGDTGSSTVGNGGGVSGVGKAGIEASGSGGQNDSEKPINWTNSDELKKTLTPLQYNVTQLKFTEQAFTGAYVNLTDNGIYRCVVCGEPLFSSQCKYKTGSGWPSFNDAINSDKIQSTIDLSYGMNRTEISCKKCGAHLGHVFRFGKYQFCNYV